MFDWLIKEMAKIKTRKFHLNEGPASTEFREMVRSTRFPLPASYKEFVLRFGNTKLFRRSSYWLIEVYAGPREAESEQGESLIQFGRTHTTLSYFKETLLLDGNETPVFEWRHGERLHQAADGFISWLQGKCSWARKHYKKKEWEAIERGPEPFTPQERAIVEARKRFSWRVSGLAPNGYLQFEIRNDSSMVLPYLSVGVLGTLRPPKSGPLRGGAFLPVSSIFPGETKIIGHDCYTIFVIPERTEVFNLPDPGPEDREQYWEFKKEIR